MRLFPNNVFFYPPCINVIEKRKKERIKAPPRVAEAEYIVTMDSDVMLMQRGGGGVCGGRGRSLTL